MLSPGSIPVCGGIGRRPVAELGKQEGELRIALLVLEDQALRELRREAQQALIVCKRHHHIQVVVPGDEAAVADGPDQGPAAYPITEPPLFAEADETLKDIQDLLLLLRHALSYRPEGFSFPFNPGSAGSRSCARAPRVCHSAPSSRGSEAYGCPAAPWWPCCIRRSPPHPGSQRRPPSRRCRQ